MSDIVNPILQWLYAHPHLAGIGTFIISASESVAIIGTIIPGSVMMTAIGTLAGAGVIPLWSTIIWAILGAIVGDSISYWMGYHFKDRIHSIWPFRKYPSLLANGETFFKKHGGKSVFIGRFVGPVRALVPLVAGMLRMKPWRFAIANVTSAIGWAPAYMLPGIALGAASLELPPDIAVHAILMLLLITLFIILCLWIIRKLFLLISEQINQTLTHIWQRLQSSRHFFIIATALKHYKPSKTHGQLTLAFYFIITVTVFAYLATYVQLHGSDNIFINQAFLHFFRSMRTPFGDTLFSCISLLAEATVLLPVAFIFFAWLVWKKYWHTAWHVLALSLISAAGIKFFKTLILSERPWGILQSPLDSSFPSGHATLAITIFLGLALLLTKDRKPSYYRTFIYSIACTAIGAIGISRLYLGAHWFTDVISGILLGTAILMLIILSYNRKFEKPIPTKGILTVFFLALLVSYSVNAYFRLPKLIHNTTQIDWPLKTFALNVWWQQKNDDLPLYRINRFGLATQKLNLQWLGDLNQIKTELLKNGWQIPPESDWINVLHRLSDVESSEHLPLVSALYIDKKPVLVLIKSANGNKKLIVLRLWDSRTQFKSSNLPLWVGTVEIVPRTYSWLFKHTRASDINFKSTLLFTTKPKNYDIKEIDVKNNRRSGNKEQTIILIKPKGI